MLEKTIKKLPIVKTLLHAQVIIKPTPINEVTSTGLIIPKMALENIKPTTGTVLVKGSGTKDMQMDDINVGDLVLFASEAGIDIEIRGEAVKILPYPMIICVL